MLRILHVVGARPNYMKMGPILLEMAKHPDLFEQRLVHTGQHYDSNMSSVFFDELSLPRPDVNLQVGSASHAVQTAQVMTKFEPVLLEYQPDWVFVPGDINSTIACALVAAKLGFKVAHVEAGLRSFDRTMPEELNRLLTDQLADLLLTPSRDGDENLLREGIPAEKIRFVGNVMIDTLVRLLPIARRDWPALASRLGVEQFALATLHRPSNVDDPRALTDLIGALNEISQTVPVVFPVHPRTNARIESLGLSCSPNIKRVEPLGYLDFLACQAHAAVVVTDSGGVQEETTYLGTPCLTVRPNTERPVTITQGTNRLIQGSREALISETLAAVKQGRRGEGYQPPEFWDGRASERIVSVMRTLN